jgi:predicted Fe-Mo cluster-binding NifX family protein
LITKAIPIPFERLATPAQRALRGAGYSTLQQLAKAHESDIAALHGIGPNALAVLKRELAASGLAFQEGRP